MTGPGDALSAASSPRSSLARSCCAPSTSTPTPTSTPAVIHTLTSCEWVKKACRSAAIGDTGTGKSYLLIALGTEAAMAGFRSATP